MYTTDIGVKNSIGFCTNTDRNVLNALEQRFVGTCFMGAFILGINRIIRRSSCKIVSSNNTGHGNINIEFEARVIVFSRWDIVTNAKIKVRDQFLIATAPAKPDRANQEELVITVKPVGRTTDSLTVGQIVPLRLITVLHAPRQKHVNCEAVLLTCDKNAPKYIIKDKVNIAIYADVLRPLLNLITIELDLRNGMMTDAADSSKLSRYNFFERLLYSYASTAPNTDTGVSSQVTLIKVKCGDSISPWAGVIEKPMNYNSEGYELVNFITVIHQAVSGKAICLDGAWTRSLHLPRSSPLIMRKTAAVPIAVPGKPAEYIEISSIDLVITVLGNIYNFLKATRNLVDIYNQVEIDKHRNIWAEMRAAQIQIKDPI